MTDEPSASAPFIPPPAARADIRDRLRWLIYMQTHAYLALREIVAALNQWALDGDPPHAAWMVARADRYDGLAQQLIAVIEEEEAPTA